MSDPADAMVSTHNPLIPSLKPSTLILSDITTRTMPENTRLCLPDAYAYPVNKITISLPDLFATRAQARARLERCKGKVKFGSAKLAIK